MQAKFEKHPSTTGVMELMAQYEKVNVKDIILNFLKLDKQANKIMLKKEEGQNGSVSYNLINTEPIVLKKDNTTTIIHRMNINVDDFNFNYQTIFKTDSVKGFANETLSKNANLTKEWRKVLFDFDKDYMFCEFSELLEYHKFKNFEAFYKDYNHSQENNEKAL